VTTRRLNLALRLWLLLKDDKQMSSWQSPTPAYQNHLPDSAETRSSMLARRECFRRKSRSGCKAVPSLSSFEEESKMASSNQGSGSKGGNMGGSTGTGSGSGNRGGTPEQDAEAGRQSHKNDPKTPGQGGSASGGMGGGAGSSGGSAGSGSGTGSAGSGSTRGGTPEQHSQAGRQSHKNDDKK
jgi:hypothetical protein